MTTTPRSLPETEPDASDTIADHLEDFFRTVVAPDDALRSPVCMRYITHEAHPFGNLALFTRDATGEDIARDAAPLREDAFPSAICLLNDGAPEQIRAANDLGFVHAESMPTMSVAPGALAPTSVPEGYTYREALVEEAGAWARAVSDGYGLPLGVGSLFSVDRAAAKCPGRAHFFAVEHEGQMVATSVLYLHDGLAGIYGVATLPAHRGKGLAAHLTAEPLRMAWDMGYTTGLLQASEMGAPVYSRIGFKTHGHMELLVRVPG